MLDAEPIKGPADLGEALPVRRLSARKVDAVLSSSTRNAE
jgi:hypothetical protein